MKIKIKGIAPYPGLRDLLIDVVGEDDRFYIDVEVADLEEALPIVLNAQEQNYDVIVSRGGTASFIRQHASIPVVDIPVSGYDILRVLTLIKDSNSSLAIIGFPNICQGARTVSSLLNVQIPIYSIHHESEVRDTLIKAVQDGAQIVLGDVVTVTIAQEMGLHGILITSGTESIQEMLMGIEYILEIYRKGQEKKPFFQPLLEHHPSAILVIDIKGQVQYMNECGKRWIGDRQTLPSELQFLLKAEGIQTQRIDFEPVLMDHQSFHIHSVPNGENIFLYLERQAKQEQPLFQLVQMPERLASFAVIMGSSQALTKVVKRAKAYAKSDKHVWISGEAGTGRTTFAEAIYSASPRNQARFYRVDCYLVDEERLTMELFGTESKQGLFQRLSKDTLYLKDIDKLSLAFQEKLADKLRKGSSIRVISSTTLSHHELLSDAHFHQELHYLIGECKVEIPPLRQRTEDIKEIARVFIAKHNSLYGKQVVGIRDEVLSHMSHYRWPGNIKELENRLGELMVLAKGHYIELEEWQLVWEGYPEEDVYALPTIDLNGTWEQIEKQILKEVLKKEGMNQTKAAKRLGISRATLWRKLQ